MLRQALAGNPNNSTVLSLCAFCNVMLGDLAFGRECYLHALQIAPGALDNYEILLGVGLSHLVSGEFEQALEWAQRSLAANGEWIGAHWTLVASFAHLGRMDEAHAGVATLLRKAPFTRMSDIERIADRYSERWQSTIDGLRKAGLPD